MRTAIITVLGAILLLAGCSTKEAGTPGGYSDPATTEPDTVSTSSAKSNPSSSGQNTPNLGLPADFDACDVLNEVSAQLGLFEIQREAEVDRNGKPVPPNLLKCGAEYPDRVSVAIEISEINVGKLTEKNPAAVVSDIDLNGRQAKKVEKFNSSSSCLVMAQLNSSATVAFSASANVSLAQACDAATKVANAAESKLPW